MPPPDYTTWTPEQLVDRVRDLESKLNSQNAQILTLKKAVPVPVPPAGAAPPPPPAQPAKPPPKRPFDFSRHETRRVALKIAYLGKRYNGFEHHANNSTRLPTVEEVVWRALAKTRLIPKDEDGDVDWDGCEYSKAGRTDKGVSAFGNVIALRVRSARRPPRSKARKGDAAVVDLPGEVEEAEQEESAREKEAEVENEEKEEPFDPVTDEISYPRVINRVLPPDIRVLAWCPSVPADFSARFSCRLRKYRYFFTNPAFCPAPEERGTSKRRIGGAERAGWLDVDAMRDAAKRLEGAHDFRNFCKQDPARQISNFERRIDRARIVKVPGGELNLPFAAEPALAPLCTGHEPRLYALEVWGSAFLWHQVRCMAAVLFLVGQGLERPGLVDRLLDVAEHKEKPLYEMADDHPLVLWDCVFPDLAAGGSEESLQWIPPDHPTRQASTAKTGDGRYGFGGINEVLWTRWRRAKIDEVLAGELLGVAASDRVGPGSSPRPAEPDDAWSRADSTRVFDGSDEIKQKGVYVPVLDRARQEAPEKLNARWLERNPHKARAARADVDE